MTFITQATTCAAYRKAPPPLEPHQASPQAVTDQRTHAGMVSDVQGGLRATWSAERLQRLCTALVCGHMRLSRRDLQVRACGARGGGLRLSQVCAGRA